MITRIPEGNPAVKNGLAVVDVLHTPSNSKSDSATDLNAANKLRLNQRPAALLFDLDGTLTDSGPLVVSCFRQMLERLWGSQRASQISEAQLWSYLGPPLLDSMFDLEPGCSRERAEEMVVAYREIYLPLAATAPLFPGVEQMLRSLQAAGYRMAVATSKLQEPAVEVIAARGLSGVFETVSGGVPEVNSSLKHEVVAAALDRMNLSHPNQASQVLMVGDRHYDIAGAAQVGVPAVLASWGDLAHEGEDKGAIAVVDTPAELVSLLS